ncbi:MAG: transposase, partial [Kiritimatiellae bacterium]|nr:transposase [Verrucomicrobiota bacterium]MBU4289626.1 transposase [Verrucomicrobiota bacterium]MCG2680220.1 transposase [Kiritimatiellia bacterium]
MKRYLGVDLHRNCFTVHTRQEDGSGESREWSIRSLKAFAKAVTANDAVAVEATGNVRLFCEALKGRGCRIVVVNPHQFQVISRSVKKTDEHDAKVLAEFLAKDMLPEVRMKDEAHARVASLASEKGLAGVLAAPVSELEHLELEILVGEIRHLNESIKKLEGLLHGQGPKLPGWENLTSIKGIGDTGASILLSTIGKIEDFADEGKLAAYFGIVPRVSNSNETERSGRITKRGCKLGRTTLVQCALIAARVSACCGERLTRSSQAAGASMIYPGVALSETGCWCGANLVSASGGFAKARQVRIIYSGVARSAILADARGRQRDRWAGIAAAFCEPNVCHEDQDRKEEIATAQQMRESKDLSEPPCRRRLQTALSCFDKESR